MKINLVDKNGVTLKTAGTYVEEDIQVGLSEADQSALVAENIAKDKTILGVTGTLESGGDTTQEDALLEGKLTTYSNSTATKVKPYAFYNDKLITELNLPRVKEIGGNAFYQCTNLTKINIPNIETLKADCFTRCYNLDFVIGETIKSLGDTFRSFAFNGMFTLWNENNFKAGYDEEHKIYPWRLGEYAIESGLTIYCEKRVNDSNPIGNYSFNTTYKGRPFSLSTIYVHNITIERIQNDDYTFDGSGFGQGCGDCVTYKDFTTFSSNFIYYSDIKTVIYENTGKYTNKMDSFDSNYPFSNAYGMTELVLKHNSVISLSSIVSTVFENCYHYLGTVHATYNPDGLKDGKIYVPDDLVEDYKVATNWVEIADLIYPLSEYVEWENRDYYVIGLRTANSSIKAVSYSIDGGETYISRTGLISSYAYSLEIPKGAKILLQSQDSSGKALSGHYYLIKSTKVEYLGLITDGSYIEIDINEPMCILATNNKMYGKCVVDLSEEV